MEKDADNPRTPWINRNTGTSRAPCAAANGNIVIDDPKPREPTYIYTIASIKLSKTRGLMFYAVSLLNPLHTYNHLDSAIAAMKPFIHPETRRPNVVVHVTDGIYAFNFMTDDPDLSYEDAREMARAAGRKWIKENMFRFVRYLGFVPVVFHWDQWDGKHAQEYDAALAQLSELRRGDNEAFREYLNAVDHDVDRFVARTVEKRGAEGSQVDSRELARIRENSLQFVIHENSGYILIGRHIVADYMEVLRAKQPDYATVIEGHGGLMDGAFRLYPGGQLKSIEWLQKNRKKLPQSLWGAERVTPIKIEFRYIETSNEYAYRTPDEIEFLDNLKAVRRRSESRPRND